MPSRTVLGLYRELRRALPVGIVLLLLEGPSDAESFRIVDAKRAAAEITTPNSPNLVGTSLADFPRLLETSIPGQLLATLRGGAARNLGEISYGDDHIRHGVYSVRAFPLSNNFLRCAFEGVTDPIHAERASPESA